MFALGIGPGDEVIVPAITFAASANCVVYQGGTPVFADVDPDTLLIDPVSVESRITTRTRAIIAVDYAGQPCDYSRLSEIAWRFGHALVADACHSLGASYRGRAVGTLADLTAFSFHPVKHITTGEGGMITTSRADLAQRMCVFRNHGITADHRQRQQTDSWRYEMVELGFNYRISDIQCALGRSQLKKLPEWVRRRRQIAARYDSAFAGSDCVRPLAVSADVQHAWHLYVVRVGQDCSVCDRDSLFHLLRRAGIGANVHYSPVHLHPFYQKRYDTVPGNVRQLNGLPAAF
jgi:perosamine synthetase